MNNFNFGEILTRAWQNIWKHKVLWIFGILAGCARGSGGGNSGGNYNNQTGSGDAPFSNGQFEYMINKAVQYIQQNLWVIIAIVTAGILLSFIFYALGIMGRIGLIKGNVQIENGAEKLSFAEIWAESMPYFWRIFGLNFLIGLAFAVILIPLVLLGAVTAGVGFICLLPLMCILLPIGWAVSLVIEQAQPAIVVENLSMMDGLKRGWEIVKSNAVSLIVLSLILGIGGSIIGVIIALPIIIAVIPLMLTASTGSFESFTPIYITLACCVVYLPVLIFFNGILTAYMQSAWALTYLRLSKPKEEAPLIIEANA